MDSLNPTSCTPKITYDALSNRIYHVINTFVRMKALEIEEVKKVKANKTFVSRI